MKLMNSWLVLSIPSRNSGSSGLEFNDFKLLAPLYVMEMIHNFIVTNQGSINCRNVLGLSGVDET